MRENYILIHNANSSDIPAMVSLSYTKRRSYEKAQPQFWRYKEGTEESQSKGASQILVVCGAHDEHKRQFLKELGLNVASEWYISSI